MLGHVFHSQILPQAAAYPLGGFVRTSGLPNTSRILAGEGQVAVYAAVSLLVNELRSQETDMNQFDLHPTAWVTIV